MDYKISAEQIKSNWEKLLELIDKLVVDETRKKQLLEFYQNREYIAMTPGSSFPFLHNSFPGGYVDHVLNVCKHTKRIYDVWKELGHDMSGYDFHELMFAAINHDLGKIGDENDELYVENESTWHIKNQLKYYNTNTEIDRMKIQDRSLYLLQMAGIRLSQQEYLAILTHDGLYDESNDYYFKGFNYGTKPKTNMSYILHQGDISAMRFEYERWENAYLSNHKKSESEKSDVKEHVDKKKKIENEFNSLIGD